MSGSLFYSKYFAEQVNLAIEEFYSGNLFFEVNFREGRIGNMNISAKLSIKEGESPRFIKTVKEA